MASIRPSLRPLACWETVLKHSRLYRPQKRCFADMLQNSTLPAENSQPPPPTLTSQAHKRAAAGVYSLIPPKSAPRTIANPHSRPPKHAMKPIKVFPPPPSVRKACKEPAKTINSAQIALLDPTGARTRLFSKTNPDAAKVGDILLVRQKSGEPFAGVCINIRRRGADTGILLRGQLTRVGVEMWFKVYSPNVEAIEVVQRRQKRARRARLYYMRQPKHDVGSVENVVRQYLRERAMLGKGGNVKGRDANSNRKKSNKGGRK